MPVNRDGRKLGTPSAAHRIDEAALSTYLEANIPGFGGEIEVKQFLGGQSNPTYLVKARSGSYVLRKKPPGDLLPSAHAVDREYRVISALSETAVPVPRTHLLCEDEDVIGQMFYIMDYVPGRVFTDPALPGCSPAGRTAIYEATIEVLGSLHGVDYQAVGLETFGRASGYVARQVAVWSRQYEASKLEESAPMDKLMAWLPEHNPDDDQVSIVHGDYRPGNIIYENGQPGVAAVLDWELSTIGHPLADLGYFLMLYRLDANSAIGGINGLGLDELGIPAEKVVVEAYAKRVGHQRTPGVTYYIVFSRFRLAAILAGVLGRGIEGNAADPRAIELGRTYKQLADDAWKIAADIKD